MTLTKPKSRLDWRQTLNSFMLATRRLQPSNVVWALVLAALAIFMCFVPLLNILGYESSLVMALAACLAGAHLGVIHGNRAASHSPGAPESLQSTSAPSTTVKNNSNNSTAPAAPNASAPSLLSIWAKSGTTTTAILLPALAILALNAIRIKNCNITAGFSFFILLAVVSGLVASGWGTAAGAIFKSRRAGMIAVIGVGLLSLGLVLYRLYVHPQVTVYGAPFGFFSGALYDEELPIPSALLWARFYHLAGAAFAVTFAGLITWKQAPYTGSRLALPLFTGLLVALLTLWGDNLGFIQDSDSVQRALGGVHQTDHITIYHPVEFSEKEVNQLADDLEYRLHQTSAYFGLEPEVPPQCDTIQVYVYRSATQRESLVGLGNTSLARPWACQIHLIRPQPGDSVVSHEMAHVVAGRLARAPLYLPALASILPHMALVEGAAEAATVGWDNMNVHERASAMDQLGLLPDIGTIMSAQGFWTAPAGRAYTAAGSFVSWLMSNYGGVKQFSKAYQAGHIETAYGRPLNQLTGEWREFLSSVKPEQDAITEAMARYGRQSIFSRECAHERANVYSMACKARNNRRHAVAASLFDRLINMAPDQASYYLGKAQSLTAYSKSHDEAAQIAVRAYELAADTADLPAQTGALELLGDLAWREGNRAEAASFWSRAGTTAFSERSRLRLWWRLGAVGADVEAGLDMGDSYGDDNSKGTECNNSEDHARVRAEDNDEEIIRRYLIGEEPELDLAVLGLAQVVEKYPTNKLAQYLLGRHLHMRRRESQAIPWLQLALQLSNVDHVSGLSSGDQPYSPVTTAHTTATTTSPAAGPAGGGLSQPLAQDATRLLGVALYHSAQYDSAKNTFRTLESMATSQGVKDVAQDWQERCNWKSITMEHGK